MFFCVINRKSLYFELVGLSHFMNFDPIAKALLQRLEEELPQDFAYHSAEAAQAQAALALELGQAASLTDAQLLGVCWAVLCVPFGYLADYERGAAVAADEAAKRLLALNAASGSAALAERLLRQLMERPHADDFAAQVFSDALMAERGREDCFIRFAELRTEWRNYRPRRPLTDWYAELLDSLAQTEFYTPEARNRYAGACSQNLALLQALMGESKD